MSNPYRTILATHLYYATCSNLTPPAYKAETNIKVSPATLVKLKSKLNNTENEEGERERERERKD